MKVLIRTVLLAITVLLIFSTVEAETFGVKKRRPKPHEYGDVLINNYSASDGDLFPYSFRYPFHIFTIIYAPSI